MLYIESPEEAQAISRRALEMMAQHRISANPVNFTLWYSYFTGSPPDLKAAVDDLLAEGATIDSDISAALFARFFGDGEAGVKIAEAGLAIETQLEQVLRYLGDASADTGGFGEKLADLSVDLVKGVESGDVGSVVRSILLETQTVVAKSKAMEQKLSASTEEIHQLRENLNAVRHEAWTDGLTGIANRKCFDQRLQEAAVTAEAEGTPLCLLLADIDHFKKFNDTYGHRIGDLVLRLVAQNLKDGVKGADLPARYGGEEFAIILPETRLTNAATLANNLRGRLTRKELKNSKTEATYGRITLSIGVAQYCPGEALADLIQRADDGLYAAKAAGRDCVVTETELPQRASDRLAG